jgi:hypothetical protein
MIPCIYCEHNFEDHDFIRYFTVAWPKKKWLYFLCPQCGRGAYIKLELGYFAIGELDGAKPPSFIEKQTVSVPGLSFHIAADGIRVRIGQDYSRLIPKR